MSGMKRFLMKFYMEKNKIWYMSVLRNKDDIEKMPACNRQFGASGGVVSWDTSQEFGSSPPVRALPIPPPAAKLLKRCRQSNCETSRLTKRRYF